MIDRLLPAILLPILVLAAAPLVALAAFGQPGFFGRVSARLKAGDFAPDLVFTQVLHAPERAPWNPADYYRKSILEERKLW